MTCEMCNPLLSEYADGRLDAIRRDRVEMHLAQCPGCAALARDFRAIGGLLRGLPVSQTSPRFDALLAERLAQTRSARTPWLSRLADGLRPPPFLWRPALAFSAAAAAIAGAVAFQHPSVPVEPTPVSEGALVTHCVQQHRSYVGAQPLSDPAAQSLADQLDATGAVPTAATPGDGDL